MMLTELSFIDFLMPLINSKRFRRNNNFAFENRNKPRGRHIKSVRCLLHTHTNTVFRLQIWFDDEQKLNGYDSSSDASAANYKANDALTIISRQFLI